MLTQKLFLLKKTWMLISSIVRHSYF